MLGCVGQGQEWGLCLGETEKTSVTELLDTPQTAMDNPGVMIKRAIKLCSVHWEKWITVQGAVNASLTNTVTWSLFGPSVLRVTLRRENSLNNVQQKNPQHRYLFCWVLTKWSLSGEISFYRMFLRVVQHVACTDSDSVQASDTFLTV